VTGMRRMIFVVVAVGSLIVGCSGDPSEPTPSTIPGDNSDTTSSTTVGLDASDSSDDSGAVVSSTSTSTTTEAPATTTSTTTTTLAITTTTFVRLDPNSPDYPVTEPLPTVTYPVTN